MKTIDVTTGGSRTRLPVYALISLLAVYGAVMSAQPRTEAPVRQLSDSISFAIVQDQSFPYYAISANQASLIVISGSSVSVAITVASLNGFSAATPCGSAWWGSINLGAQIAPSTTSGPALSMNPSCITLNSGGTAFTTLVVTAAALTRPGSYSVTVVASFRVSPSGWSTWRATTVFVTVVQNVYLVPAMLTVIVMIAAAIGGVAATSLVRTRTILGRTGAKAQDMRSS